MRQIKFRAWDKETHNWEYFIFDQLGEPSQTELENTIGIGSPIWVQVVSKEKRMDFSTFGQFTDLKDKNGQEIYEADIICRGDRKVMCVKWDNSTTGFAPFNGKLDDSGDWWEEDDCEVIGNIYENPELLTANS